MRTTRLVARILAVVGLALVVVAGALGLYESFAREAWASAIGRIVDHDFDGKTYRALVRFQAEDGRSVDAWGQVRASRRSPGLGEAVPVRYDPARPQDARIDTLLERWFLPGLFGLIGAVVFALGAGVLAYLRIARRRDSRLRLTGARHAAEVVGVRRNDSTRYDESAWRVEARWTDPLTGETRTALSRHLDFDPAPWLADRIDVFVDRDRPKLTLVDLAEIEAAARR